MVSAPNSPPRSPRGDEIIGKLREPPPLRRKLAGTSRSGSSNLDEADLEILDALERRLDLNLQAASFESLNPPANSG